LCRFVFDSLLRASSKAHQNKAATPPLNKSTVPTHLIRVEPIEGSLLLGLAPCAMRYRLFGFAVRAPADSPLIVERQSF
ncbi:MAG: hypothetical protein IKL43_07240, partial [Alistipes sp.]|nr:hypothetical protein [Alistipes sp.]